MACYPAELAAMPMGLDLCDSVFIFKQHPGGCHCIYLISQFENDVNGATHAGSAGRSEHVVL